MTIELSKEELLVIGVSLRRDVERFETLCVVQRENRSHWEKRLIESKNVLQKIETLLR